MTEDDHVVSFSLFSAVSCVEEKKELDDEWKRKEESGTHDDESNGGLFCCGTQ
jgi:hypothetical protein